VSTHELTVWHGHQTAAEMIVAVDCNDRRRAILRSSSLGDRVYGCKSCHKWRIVSVNDCQNEDKSVRERKIRQTKKKKPYGHLPGSAKSVDLPGFPGEADRQ
jgi:hypothetical protein